MRAARCFFHDSAGEAGARERCEHYRWQVCGHVALGGNLTVPERTSCLVVGHFKDSSYAVNCQTSEIFLQRHCSRIGKGSADCKR